MKSKHIARAIGILAALADEYYDKDGGCDGQPKAWHDLRSSIHHLTSALEEVSRKEATNGTT